MLIVALAGCTDTDVTQFMAEPLLVTRPDNVTCVAPDLAAGEAVVAHATVQGVARRAYELALEYARNRVQGGRPIIDHQVIGLLFLRARWRSTEGWGS